MFTQAAEEEGRVLLKLRWRVRTACRLLRLTWCLWLFPTIIIAFNHWRFASTLLSGNNSDSKCAASETAEMPKYWQFLTPGCAKTYVTDEDTGEKTDNVIISVRASKKSQRVTLQELCLNEVEYYMKSLKTGGCGCFSCWLAVICNTLCNNEWAGFKNLLINSWILLILEVILRIYYV